MSQELLEDIANNRVSNVKTIAYRICQFAEGHPTVELLDALALAGGTLIKAFYIGPGVDEAMKRFAEQFINAALGK